MEQWDFDAVIITQSQLSKSDIDFSTTQYIHSVQHFSLWLRSTFQRSLKQCEWVAVFDFSLFFEYFVYYLEWSRSRWWGTKCYGCSYERDRPIEVLFDGFIFFVLRNRKTVGFSLNCTYYRFITLQSLGFQFLARGMHRVGFRCCIWHCRQFFTEHPTTWFRLDCITSSSKWRGNT